MKGICLRGQPGWGEVFAPLTTVVNTFGGTWFDKDWKAQVNAARVQDGDELLRRPGRKHGEAGAPQAGFTECLNALSQGKVAMWYDATSAAGSLEASDSPVAGKIGYVAAPVEQDQELRLALHLGVGHREGQQATPDNAWKFVSWASSKDYEQLVGDASSAGPTCRPASAPSTYTNPDYQKAAAPSPTPTQDAIRAADPRNPGVQPRPDARHPVRRTSRSSPTSAPRCRRTISSAIAGQTESVDARPRRRARSRWPRRQGPPK